MKVTIAKHAGFCMGVKKAMNLALEASEGSTERIYTLGQLVHNNDAVNMLKKNEVFPAESPDELHGEKVFIRAHGVPPSVKQDLIDKENDIIDATCPYVKKVQNIAHEYAEKGYSVVISGDDGHAEVVGLLGFCDGKGYVVSNKQEVARLPELGKVCVIAQTTQSRENFDDTIAALRSRFSEVVVENTICGATTVRQKEVLELAKAVDLVIVVGGKHSANTKRLEDLSLSAGTPTVLIENASQLDYDLIRRYSSIGITAGASTPSWVIDEVAQMVERTEIGTTLRVVRSIEQALHFVIDTSIFLGIGAVSLYYAIAYFINFPAFADPKLPVLIFLFINSVHFLNSTYAERIMKNGEEPHLMQRMGFKVAILSIAGSLILSYFVHRFVFTIHLALCVLGILYRKITLSKVFGGTLKFKSLKDIPASKDVSQAIAWVIIIVGYPAIINSIDIFADKKIWVAAFFVFSTVFARSIVYDIKEIRLDKLIGKETLPVLLGDTNTKISLILLLGTLMTGIMYIKVRYLTYVKINIFLYSLLYMIVYLYLFHKKVVYKGYLLNFIIDGQFIFTGLITYLLYV